MPSGTATPTYRVSFLLLRPRIFSQEALSPALPSSLQSEGKGKQTICIPVRATKLSAISGIEHFCPFAWRTCVPHCTAAPIMAGEYSNQPALRFATQPSSLPFSNDNTYPWSRRESVLLETEGQVPHRVNGRLPERQPAPGTPIHIAQRQLPRARDRRQPQNVVLQEQLVLYFGTYW
jgi:hypothetical protein